MPKAFDTRGLPRFDPASQRLAVALALSLALHALLFGVWKTTPVVRTFVREVIQRTFPKIAQALQAMEAKPPPPKTTPPPVETPLIFVQVDPAAPTEAPKAPKFYSTADTTAANPNPRTPSDVPKIDGTQTKIVRLADNPKPVPKPLQPTPPTPQPEDKKPPEKHTEPKPETKPRPQTPIGDLAMVKPQPKPAVGTGAAETETPRQKPRTLKEAMQRNPTLAGQKMAQDGGVQRRSHLAMVDAKGSPFGDYDAAFISAVEQRWFQLLENNQYMLDRQGKVVLDFRLHFDGRISNLETAQNSVGELLGLLCQKAILDPAPFPKWPKEMRQAVRDDFRDVRFTFYYDCNCP